MTFCSTVSLVATASRQMFAFARDRSLPFAAFLSHVSACHKIIRIRRLAIAEPEKVKPGLDVPLNSIFISFIVNCLLSLINIGSSVAFNATVSLIVTALLSSYLISISCVLLKRWRSEALPTCRWSLGKWGVPINVVAIVYLSLAYFVTFWSLYTPVTAETFNWPIKFMMLCSSLRWVTIGRMADMSMMALWF